MSARFTFGDIIENGWASDSNPRKRGVYLWSFTRTGRMNPGKHVKLLHDDGRTGELRIADDDKMTVIGTIFDAKVASALSAKDAEIALLRDALEAAREWIGILRGSCGNIELGSWDERDPSLIEAETLAKIDAALQPTSGGEA